MVAINSELKSQLQALVGQLSLRDVPSGLMLWWPGAKLPKGKRRDKSDASPLTQLDWENYYALIVQGAIQQGWLPSLGEVTAKLRDVPQDGPVPLCLSAFSYSRFKRPFIERVDGALNHGTALPAPPNSVNDVIKSRQTFFAACLLPQQWGQPTPKVRARVFQIELSRQLFMTNPGAPLPDEVWVDTGLGERQMRFGERTVCVAAGRESVQVNVRARWGKRWRYASCTIAVSEQAAARRPDEVWPLSVPGGASGRANVYRSSRSTKARRYLIVCEGFPGGYPADYLVDNLNQHGMFDAILAAGTDVITVGLNNGLQAIEPNAEVVIACIQKASASGKNHVVGGVSMGGMISRYALLAMQSRGIAHHTAAYLSIDTPHQGSRTSVSVQWFAHYFKDVVPRMGDMCALLDSPANQQFLPLWFNNNSVTESPLRTRLYQAYARMGGYPTNVKLFAVASGRGDAKSAFSAGSPMVSWENSMLAGAKLNALSVSQSAAPVAHGQWLLEPQNGDGTFSMTAEYCWESVAGSTNEYNAIIYVKANSVATGQVKLHHLTACTVPTVSALDLKQAPTVPVPSSGTADSPFNAYICAAENLPHTAITPEIRDWVLEKLHALSVEQTGTDHG